MMEPIAIIGIGCRLPGNCDSPSKLWELLKEGRSAHSKVPPCRFKIDSWYHPQPQRRGFVPATGGYFLSQDESHLKFDPSFFGISPLEAQSIDPQQRKFLEVVYETFESAGVRLEDVSGSLTACYVGCFTSDYKTMQQRTIEGYAPYDMTGMDMTILSNRINYVFNLKGPSLTVDTACSSSLYALHLACQSLLSGDCGAAIVGGTNMVLDVAQQLGTASLGVLSPTSICHTFDESADGFGRADGITAIYIKTLAAAIANGDTIRGVIRSTAINTNGKSSGINHPETAGQEAVIRKAYSRASLNFLETGFFECHGTGTPVGDPIECAAVGNIFASGRKPETPLLLGSLKTNLGHTEGASGIASVIKCVLSLEHAMIPGNAGFKRLNPQIDLRGGRLAVVRDTVPWPAYQQYRRASISGFGYGGANAHVIIDAASCYFERLENRFDSPLLLSASDTQCPARKQLLVFSAHNKQSLEKTSFDVLSHVPRHRMLDVAYTLSAHRSRLSHRCFVVADGPDDISNVMPTHRVSNGKAPIVAFVFTGQGAQWPRMGYDLVARFAKVRQTFVHLQSVLDSLPCPPSWRLLDELSKPAETSLVYDVELSQPLGTAVQIALVDLFRSWNIRPRAVTAHSSGEVAAAYAAGAITSAEAITVAYCRGLAVARRSLPGAMLAVGLGAEKVAPYLCAHPNVVIACYNSPQSITLSGTDDEIEQLLQRFNVEQVFARKVNSSGNGYHSPLVRDAAQYLFTEFATLLPQDTETRTRETIPMYSCVTANKLLADDFGVKHWLRNLEDPVLFNQALQALVKAETAVDLLIEVGPHSALSGPIRQILSMLGPRGGEVSYHASLVRGKSGVDNVLSLAGNLFTHSYPINMELVNSSDDIDENPRVGVRHGTGKLLVDLPTYQWTYEKTLWNETRLSRAVRFRKYPNHDLLGSLEASSSLYASSPTWHNALRLKDVVWVADHKIGRDILFPAAGYAAMALEALRQITEERGYLVHAIKIRDLSILSPFLVPSEGHIETMVNFQTLGTADSSSWSFLISSISPDGRYTEHVRGRISHDIHTDNLAKPCGESLEISQQATAPGCNLTDAILAKSVAGKQTANDRRWYKTLAKLGLHYGRAFQPLVNIRTDPDGQYAVADILLRERGTESRYLFHPTLLDGCLQLSFINIMHGKAQMSNKAYLPIEFRSLRIDPSAIPASGLVTVRASARLEGLRDAIGCFKIMNSEMETLAEAEVAFKSIEGDFGKSQSANDIQPFTRLLWNQVGEKSHSLLNENSSGASDAEVLIPPQYLVYYMKPHALLIATQAALRDAGVLSPTVRLEDVCDSIPRDAHVIVFVELEKPLLAQASPPEFDAVQSIFRSVSSVIWITHSGILSGGFPQTSLLSGIAKTIRTERPALKLYTIDFDPTDYDFAILAKVLYSQTINWTVRASAEEDIVLAVKDNQLFASQFVTDEDENSKFRMSHSSTVFPDNLSAHFQLNFQQVGKIDTFYFSKNDQERKELGPNDVMVEPRAWLLSKADTMILKGRQSGHSTLYESIGVVSAVGRAVKSLDPGQVILCLTTSQFGTSTVLHQSLCIDSTPEASQHTNILGSIVHYCTAINALMNHARVAEGETLLLHSLDYSLTRACLTIASTLGLKVLATCTTDSDNQVLLDDENLTENTLITLETSDLEQQLSVATSGKGPDIVIGASADSTLHKVWSLLARNGRMILTSSANGSDFSGWDFARGFSRGATIASFNLADMVQSEPQQLGDLLNKAVKMIEENHIPENGNVVKYDISKLPEAIEAVTSSTTSHKVVVECSSESIVPTLCVASRLMFSPTASYILVGSLGGLGRSLTLWMADHGARHFLFLSRSGSDKPEASTLVEELKTLLAHSEKPWSVEVIRGDVACRADVDEAVSKAIRPIKGVIQASMVLENHLFTEMPLSAWNAVLAPKVRGTENLHSALQHADLDFFVMTSSAIGVLGIPTQGAYAAANAFMDAMARHRWAQGLQACSLALGMVTGIGHVAENSDIEEALQRYGSYPINEDEFLSALETACTRQDLTARRTNPPASQSADWLAGAHLLTGFDLSRSSKYFVRGSPAARWLEDPRLRGLVAELDAQRANAADVGLGTAEDASVAPLKLLRQTLSSAGVEAAKDLLQDFVLKKFAALTQVEVEKLAEGVERPMAAWGVDSLVGSEIRRWAWEVWGVDVPFLGLVEGGMSLAGLVGVVWEGVGGGRGERGEQK